MAQQPPRNSGQIRPAQPHPAQAAAPRQQRKQTLGIYGSDQAPVIFSDGVYAWAASGGVVGLELGQMTQIIVDGQVRGRPLCAAHLRMTEQAARSMIDALQSALDRLEELQAGVADEPPAMQ